MSHRRYPKIGHTCYRKLLNHFSVLYLQPHSQYQIYPQYSHTHRYTTGDDVCSQYIMITQQRMGDDTDFGGYRCIDYFDCLYQQHHRSIFCELSIQGL